MMLPGSERSGHAASPKSTPALMPRGGLEDVLHEPLDRPRPYGALDDDDRARAERGPDLLARRRRCKSSRETFASSMGVGTQMIIRSDWLATEAVLVVATSLPLATTSASISFRPGSSANLDLPELTESTTCGSMSEATHLQPSLGEGGRAKGALCARDLRPRLSAFLRQAALRPLPS